MKPENRYDAIVATVELYRDGVLSVDQARLILRGLGAQNRTVLMLKHGYEPRDEWIAAVGRRAAA